MRVLGDFKRMELLGEFGSIVLTDLGSMGFWEILELWNYYEILKV